MWNCDSSEILVVKDGQHNHSEKERGKSSNSQPQLHSDHPWQSSLGIEMELIVDAPQYAAQNTSLKQKH